MSDREREATGWYRLQINLTRRYVRRPKNQQLARCVIFPFGSIRQATRSVSQYKLQFTPVELISSMYRLFQTPPPPHNLSPTHRLTQVLSNFLPAGKTELKHRRNVRISTDHQSLWHPYITPCSKVLEKPNNSPPVQQTSPPLPTPKELPFTSNHHPISSYAS